MKKNILWVPVVTSALLTFTSCTKDFGDTNTDPNRIESISPGTLLNPIIYSVSAFNTSKSDDVTFHLMQVKLPFPSVSGGIHRYDLSESAGNSTWSTYYRWLTNVKEMKQAAIKAEDKNYQAVAMTLNAWIYANLTDAFGDVPMDEAARGDEGIFRPAFNTQQQVYEKLLSGLDSANALFNTTQPMIYATDILYANDVASWRRLCNSLQLRLLLRVSNRPEMDAWNKMRNILDHPDQYPVFKSNTQAAILKMTGITPNVSPWGRAIDFTTFMATGKFFLDNLNDFNDPRREKFATMARTPGGASLNEYRGIPSGFANDAQFDYLPSNMNVALVTAPMISVLMSYAELEFIRAEVELHFGNETAAKTAYEAGVKAAIEQWGAVMPTDYFQNEKAAYNGTLERIMLQKYYALFFTDYQQWFEYRRTGFPVLPVASGMLNGGKMPVRFKYPTTVQSNNTANYQKAVQSMGGDDINTLVWWDK